MGNKSRLRGTDGISAMLQPCSGFPRLGRVDQTCGQFCAASGLYIVDGVREQALGTVRFDFCDDLSHF